ncbi:MAG: MFS transporter [Deltaproteobacteria bacterium]|jgi:acyl-[acyl-carrier-protein]-phospholipid O-acyltransferase/long-chain-fatty-acid--[acyl-carrier-protein] ligase|nr:MFS transporter [Deltaproteobacteria bacterium]
MTFRPILTKPAFWPLFGTMSLGAFNDNCFRQALIAGLAFGTLGLETGSLTSEAKSILGSLAMSLLIIPFFLFSSLAGELADRYRKSTLVKLTKIFELVCILLAGYFFLTGQIYPLLVMLFFMGTQSAFFGPLKYGLLPEILTPKELLAGNGLVSGSTFIAIILGTMAGSFAVTQTGGLAILLPITLVLAAALGVYLAFKQPTSELGDSFLKIDPLIWRSTYAIIKSVRDQRKIWLSILAISWFWSMGSIILTQLPVLTNTVMGATPAVNTFMVTMFAVGVAVGSLLVQTLNQGRITAVLVPITSVFLTLFMALLAWSSAALPLAEPGQVTLTVFLTKWPYVRLALCALAVSVAGGLFVVPLNALIQHSAKSNQRARVIAANNIINSIFIVTGSLLVMLMIKLNMSIAQVFMMVTVSALIVTVMTLLFLPESTLITMARFIMWAIYRPKIKGLENFDALGDKKIILTPNHTSFFDVALLVAYIPRRLTFAIDTNWSKVWWVKIFTSFFETIPINPGSPMSTRDLINAVTDGQTLVIFPEGRMTTTDSVMKIHEGPGLIAAKCRMPIMPIIFEGPQYSWFGRLRKIFRNRPRRFDVSMTIFPARVLGYDLRPGERKQAFRKRLAEEIYETLVQAKFQAQDYRQNLWKALLTAAKNFGPKRLIIEDLNRKPVSYGTLIKMSRIIGRFLAKKTGPKEKVGVLLPNTVPLTAVIFGLWAGGRVPVILNYTQGRGHLKSAIETAEVKTLVTSSKFLKATTHNWLLEEMKLQFVILEDLKPSLWDKITGLLWSGQPAPADTPATVVFTSGSEDHPKGVALSHQNLLANILQAKSVVEVNIDDILFNSMPAFHAFGLNVGCILPLILGIRSFSYLSPLHVKIVPELIYDTKASIIIGSDTFASAWSRNAHSYDFHTAKFVLLGAEKVQPRTMEYYFHHLNLRLFEGYGVTEASPILAVGTPMRVRDGSVGRLLPGLEYRLKPVPGLASGGCLEVRGPNIMMGYIRATNPGVIAPLTDGWYNTGDIVEIDDDGFVWIKGRYKRFAKISGEMISLGAIEDIAAQLWPSEKTAVLSFPDEAKGEKLILISKSHSPDLSALRQAVRDKGLSELSCPKVYLTLPDIPLNPLGKIDLMKLTQTAEEALKRRIDN